MLAVPLRFRDALILLFHRGTLARQASELQPEANEQDMLRLLHLLRDVACGLTLLKAQHVVHADLVRT